MGDALLLQWGVLVGLVLRLPLCSTDIRCVLIPGPYLSPMFSLVKDFVGVDKMTFQFELGKPFLPFEQLMGVLPEASKELVPLPYRVSMVYFFHEVALYPLPQPLMFDFTSPILDFYPKDFEQDMNGKKQEWEAVVKIPFIDETRLLEAMACMSSSVALIFPRR